MSEHTPGPWATDAVGEYVFADGGSHPVAQVRGYGHYCKMFGDEEQAVNRMSANARLIAAAPELLEALESLYSRVRKDKDAKKWWEYEQKMARAAIAKARGEG